MKVFKIKKGGFYSSPFHFGIHLGKTSATIKVNFSKECLYTPIDWENDYNKLFGWSYGLHHQNSIRVCWRASKGQIELCIYVYKDGQRSISNHTIMVDVETDYTLRLNVEDDGVYLCDDIGRGLYMPIVFKPKWGYLMYPYFGGNNPAPHNMDIKLTKL